MENLRLKYGDVELPIQQGYTITKSSQEVSYSDLVCGWDDSYELPERYQEVQIVNIDTGVVKAYGYVDMYDFGEMRETDVERDITIFLFTPMKLTTFRTAVANGVYGLKDLIQNYILTPLIHDGFTLERFDIADRQITVNFNIETVEFCLNNLSNKFNFWWFIDENKKIYIIDISVLMNASPNFVYNDNENTIDGLQYIKPITTSDDYANVINFKNVRTYQRSSFGYDEETQEIYTNVFPLIDTQNITLKDGDEILFKYPIDLKPSNILKSIKDRDIERDVYIEDEQPTIHPSTNYYFAFVFNYKLANGSTDGAGYIVYKDGSTVMDSDLSIDTQNKDTKLTLITDPFFSNLATGIRYKGDTNIVQVEYVMSESALIWNNNKFMNDIEINKQKGKISESGIVETTIDLNDSWKTEEDLSNIAQKYFEKNSFQYANNIELLTDKNLIKVGDVIEINKFGINSNYIVTNITEKNKKNDVDYLIKAQNSSTLDNFVDVFRTEPEQQDDSREYEFFITHYNKESISNIVEVVK